MSNQIQKVIFHPLFLTHQIFVTRKQRYSIYQGEKVETVGSLIETTSINNNKDFFPKETFVKYYIDIEVSEKNVEPVLDGYKMHLPVTFVHSEINLEKIDIEKTVFIEDILDNEDGGREELFFKWKNFYTEKNKKFIISHTVFIKDMKTFDNSISFVKLN